MTLSLILEGLTMAGPGRPKYTITDDNFEEAINYFEPRLQSIETWVDNNSDNYIDAKNSFKRATKKPETLNTWCDKHLSDIHWTMLKNAINKRRSRIKNSNKNPIKQDCQVTLTIEARMMINFLAELEGKTYSNFLIDRFGKEFYKKYDPDTDTTITKSPITLKSGKVKAKQK